MIPDNRTIKNFDYAHGSERRSHKNEAEKEAFYLTKWIRRNYFWDGEITITDNVIRVSVPEYLKDELKKLHKHNKLPISYKFSSGEELKVVCSYAK